MIGDSRSARDERASREMRTEAQPKPQLAGNPDRAFAAAMIIARCRWLLTLEARGIATRLLADGSFSGQLLCDELLLAIVHKPRSRLIPWHLSDRVVERIVDAVVADMAESWT